MSYGDWRQYRRRLANVEAVGKHQFGVGCPACIPKGYTGCGGCRTGFQEWMARHNRQYPGSSDIQGAGRRMAGL